MMPHPSRHAQEANARRRLITLHQRVATALLSAPGAPYLLARDTGMSGAAYFSFAADNSLWATGGPLGDVTDITDACTASDDVPSGGFGAEELTQISDALEHWLQQPRIEPMTDTERAAYDLLSAQWDQVLDEPSPNRPT
ncbi:MAG: hypothetical protein VB135_00450 [Burkholderia sp.]